MLSVTERPVVSHNCSVKASSDTSGLQPFMPVGPNISKWQRYATLKALQPSRQSSELRSRILLFHDSELIALAEEIILTELPLRSGPTSMLR